MDADVVAREEEELHQMLVGHDEEDVDAMMADVIAQQEEAEVDALVSVLEARPQDGSGNAQFSDDEDYDGLFMNLIQSQQQQPQGMASSQDVEMS
jgi:hypothetical protein